MQDEDKSKEQLITELKALRQRVAESEKDPTERKRAEEALEESEARLKTAMDLAKLVQWEYDVKTGMFSFDEQFYALYGTTSQHEGGPQMTAQAYARRFIPPEESSVVAEAIAKTLATTDPNFTDQLEHRIIRADGEEGHIIVRWGVVCDQTGKVVKTRGANQDITDLKRAEEALLESENKFKSFAERAITGINIIQDGVFKYVNPKSAQMFGYTVEECLNDMPFKNLVYAEDLATVEEQVRRRLSDEAESVHYTFRGLKKNGQIFPLETYGSTIVYKGKPAATSTTLDITERKRAADELRESEEKYRRIFETANEGICVADGDYIVTSVNQKMADILAISLKRSLASL